MKKIFSAFALLALLGAGCSAEVSNNVTATVPSSTVVSEAAPTTTPDLVAATSTPTTTITYYLSPSPGDRNNYCNGGNMNGAGFKKVLTRQVTQVVPGNLAIEDKIKATLQSAANSEGWDETYTRTNSTTFNNGVVTLAPASGWAGSSIFECAWQPFAEKQLEQFPEVKQVKWVPFSG